MRRPTAFREIALHDTPLELARRWPADHRLLLLHSARPHPRWARWSVVGVPAVGFRHDGRRSAWIGTPPPPLRSVRFTHDAPRDLDAVLAATRGADRGAETSRRPFAGGWIGFLSYDLGRVLEPAASGAAPPPDDRGWPLVELHWCPDALAYEHGRWHAVGDAAAPPRPATPVAFPSIMPPAPPDGADRHLAAVARARAYIAAGDIYQANITHRLTGRWRGSPRPFVLDALETAGAWYGACVELADGRVLGSLSPELLVEVDPDAREVVTRPVKGTRPAGVDPARLRESAKDAAELHMIVDLARNDLGRICELGTVRVRHARRIETHPTVHHGVGEVAGRIRPDVSPAALLRAVFPGGSVTGAPKIRAMQIIDELEAARRGPYCGAVGLFGDDGRVSLNIAIRTMVFTPDPGAAAADRGILDYGVGGGIVADSDPAAEYQESLDKAAVLRAAIDAPRPTGDAPRGRSRDAGAGRAAGSRCSGTSGRPRTSGVPD
ncbi:MAG: anthranilate synthase component I family protein [Planctomycetota bacterium]|jgi:para-aminobenzoate synthetase component 1